MSDYTKLVTALQNNDWSDACPCCDEAMCKDADCIILQAAAAIEALQAELPKHGEWVEAPTAWKCSVCEAESPHTYPICPYCGSIMRTSLYDSEKL